MCSNWLLLIGWWRRWNHSQSKFRFYVHMKFELDSSGVLCILSRSIHHVQLYQFYWEQPNRDRLFNVMDVFAAAQLNFRRWKSAFQFAFIAHEPNIKMHIHWTGKFLSFLHFFFSADSGLWRALLPPINWNCHSGIVRYERSVHKTFFFSKLFHRRNKSGMKRNEKLGDLRLFFVIFIFHFIPLSHTQEKYLFEMSRCKKLRKYLHDNWTCAPDQILLTKSTK